MVGRESGLLCLAVLRSRGRSALEPKVVGATAPGAAVDTDAWSGYGGLSGKGRRHAAGPRQWARDDDGDGVREVHNNPMEGIRTGLQNFLRPFRGVAKDYLQQYVSILQWTYNLPQATPALLFAMFGGFTDFAT